MKQELKKEILHSLVPPDIDVFNPSSTYIHKALLKQENDVGAPLCGIEILTITIWFNHCPCFLWSTIKQSHLHHSYPWISVFIQHFLCRKYQIKTTPYFHCSFDRTEISELPLAKILFHDWVFMINFPKILMVDGADLSQLFFLKSFQLETVKECIFLLTLLYIFFNLRLSIDHENILLDFPNRINFNPDLP